MDSLKEPSFPPDNSIKRKLKKVPAYLFGNFPFNIESFDYDKYWEILSHENRPLTPLSKLKQFEELVDSGSNVLDIGCGEGDLLDYLCKTKHINAYGIEYGEKAVEKARARGIKVQVADISQPDFNIQDDYDYIILSEVIEHLAKPEELLLKLKGKFNKSLLITIPNTGFITERLRLLFGRFPKQWVINPSEHLRFWTVPDFKFWCDQLGYTVEKYYGLKDEYYDIRIKIWKYYPRLLSRFMLYKVIEKTR